jgi:hypothetical protein
MTTLTSSMFLRGGIPALAFLLAACFQPANVPEQPSVTQPSAAAAASATVERRPVEGGPLFTLPASAKERRASGIESPITEFSGPGYKVIIAVSPTLSLQGLGVGTVLSRARLALPGATEVLTFIPNPPVDGYARSIVFVTPLPPGPGIPQGVNVKMLVQALCTGEAACATAQGIVTSAR